MRGPRVCAQAPPPHPPRPPASPRAQGGTYLRGRLEKQPGGAQRRRDTLGAQGAVRQVLLIPDERRRLPVLGEGPASAEGARVRRGRPCGKRAGLEGRAPGRTRRWGGRGLCPDAGPRPRARRASAAPPGFASPSAAGPAGQGPVDRSLPWNKMPRVPPARKSGRPGGQTLCFRNHAFVPVEESGAVLGRTRAAQSFVTLFGEITSVQGQAWTALSPVRVCAPLGPGRPWGPSQCVLHFKEKNQNREAHWLAMSHNQQKREQSTQWSGSRLRGGNCSGLTGRRREGSPNPPAVYLSLFPDDAPGFLRETETKSCVTCDFPRAFPRAEPGTVGAQGRGLALRSVPSAVVY